MDYFLTNFIVLLDARWKLRHYRTFVHLFLAKHSCVWSGFSSSSHEDEGCLTCRHLSSSAPRNRPLVTCYWSHNRVKVRTKRRKLISGIYDRVKPKSRRSNSPESRNGRTSLRRWNIINFVWFEVLTAVVMKSSVFWDITPCIPLKFNQRFGGTCRLHLQGRSISRTRNQRESRWQAEACFS
jgi:hypothetical protein